MKFKVGKFYKHTDGTKLAIICKADTTMFGETLLAEQSNTSEFIAVGSGKEDAVNYTEITKVEWLESFD